MPILPDQEIREKMMPSEAAKILGVTTRTLTSMKDLHPSFLPSGHRRYFTSEVMAIAEAAA